VVVTRFASSTESVHSARGAFWRTQLVATMNDSLTLLMRRSQMVAHDLRCRLVLQ
jgi:hypothetical protein